jgi:hypothetical protein
MYSMFVENILVKFTKERDEDSYNFKKRVEYIYKKVKELENKSQENIENIIKHSLQLKNMLLYKVSY